MDRQRIAALALSSSLAAVAALAPLAALAQSNGDVPSYATHDETIRGSVTSFNGAYTMYVRDKRGYVDNVTLHQGTIINPTGLRLIPGMSVTIHGRANGSTFDANEIDTPYQMTYAYGYPAPVAPYWGYGYGPYGYGFPYGPGYGPPGFYPGVNFGFGFGGRWR